MGKLKESQKSPSYRLVRKAAEEGEGVETVNQKSLEVSRFLPKHMIEGKEVDGVVGFF